MQTTTLNNVQKQRVVLSILGPDNLPKPVDGVPVWVVEDSNILSIVVDSDGFGADIVTTGVVGDTNIVVTADVDLDDGVISVSGQFEVSVTESGEVLISFTFGTPERR